VLVHRAPEVVQHTVDPQEHRIEVPGVAGLRPAPVEPAGDLTSEGEHHCRMLSWVTVMPRSARISSRSRKLRLKKWYSETTWRMISAGKR
jgi:hypothetical protein